MNTTTWIPAHGIRLLIEDVGVRLVRLRLRLLKSMVLVSLLAFGLMPAPATEYADTARPPRGPQVYKAPGSDVIFYVESDGRQLTAISPTGKILWHRDPFVDAKLKPYRFAKPVIVFIGEPDRWMIADKKGQFIGISFNSSQFGIVDVSNGDFLFAGQD